MTAAVQSEQTIQRNRTWVRVWLYAISFLVFCMVIVGGATRLTDSGLSITEWQPLLGAIPPLSQADWLEALEKYRQIPEYQQINKGMSLEAFKFIYWWEWAHRFLGRFIGLVFLLPLIVFWARGMIETPMKPRLLFLFFLGGLQGFVGWWMVSSGLVDRVDVSQYRLATHLTIAFAILALAIWFARGFTPHKAAPFEPFAKTLAVVTAFVLMLQIFLGALVAGLDAGFAFNDWPTMDGAVIPSDMWIKSPFWINIFETPKTAQFVHRFIAYVTLALALFQALWTLNSHSDWIHKRRALLLFLLVLAQAAIGVATLVLQVPIFWGLAHQAGAAVVLGYAVMHWRGFVGAYPLPAAVNRASS